MDNFYKIKNNLSDKHKNAILSSLGIDVGDYGYLKTDAGEHLTDFQGYKVLYEEVGTVMNIDRSEISVNSKGQIQYHDKDIVEVLSYHEKDMIIPFEFEDTMIGIVRGRQLAKYKAANQSE